jgi:hypothetical protein
MSDKPVCNTAIASHPGKVQGPAKISVSERNTPNTPYFKIK